MLWSLGYRYAFWKFLADLHDANDRAEEVMEMLKLEKRRDVLAMNLTYAEQRALEIGITILTFSFCAVLFGIRQSDLFASAIEKKKTRGSSVKTTKSHKDSSQTAER